MIDTHCHLYGEEFDDDRAAVVERAVAAGVTQMILANEGMNSLERLHAMHDAYPTLTSITIGLHPEEVNADAAAVLAAMRPLIDQRRYVAIGEIGIDLYWDKTWREQQLEALDTQLRWCLELDLPFIIHCREGFDECLWVLDNLGCTPPPGVFHCFGGTAETVEQLRRRGDFYYGVGGTVTFKKSRVHEVLPVIGLDRIVLETDAPYLAPVPHRGTRNESSFITATCACVAQWLNLTPEQVEQATDHNAKTLFRL